MAPSLNKVANEMAGLLKKEKPSGSKSTYWSLLSEQLTEEGTWEESLLADIKAEISKWLENRNDADIKDLWEKSETAIENYEDKDTPGLDTMIIDLKDEILDMVLEKIEDANPREEYYTSYGGDKNIDLDDDNFDENKFFNDDDIPDDFDDDDIFDDDDRF